MCAYETRKCRLAMLHVGEIVVFACVIYNLTKRMLHNFPINAFLHATIIIDTFVPYYGHLHLPVHVEDFDTIILATGSFVL